MYAELLEKYLNRDAPNGELLTETQLRHLRSFANWLDKQAAQSEQRESVSLVLNQILDLHDDKNGSVCKCEQCKLARQLLTSKLPN